MLDIINGESAISLRVLDWFVTRYSKRKIDFNKKGMVTREGITYLPMDHKDNGQKAEEEGKVIIKLLKEINPMNMKGLSREKVVSQIKNLINTYYVFLG